MGLSGQEERFPGPEEEIKKVSSDPFLVFGVELLITGYGGKDVRDTLQDVIENTFERNMVQVNIRRSMAGSAPALSMIGTLIGLIVMLDSMGSDPSSLGAGLVVALNTTLFGVLLARLICVPAANKLQQRQEIQRFRNDLIVEGMSLLTEKRSPRFIQDRMNSFPDPSIRFNIDQQMKTADGHASARRAACRGRRLADHVPGCDHVADSVIRDAFIV